MTTTEEIDEVLDLIREKNLERREREDERREKFRIADSLLSECGIDHNEIISVEFGVYETGTPYASIWYKKDEKITGIVLRCIGEWKIHIHDGKEVRI